MPKFSVTYERWDEAAREAGQTDDLGFVVQDVGLREAIDELGGCANGSSCYPMQAGDWFHNDEYNHGTREYFEQGVEESRSLHVPRDITTSSQRRIARLLGVR